MLELRTRALPPQYERPPGGPVVARMAANNAGRTLEESGPARMAPLSPVEASPPNSGIRLMSRR